MTTIAIELNDSKIAEEITNVDNENVHSFETNSFDGGNGEITVLVVMTAAIVREVSRIICAAIESKKYIKVKHEGVEIEGVSEKKLIEILKLLPPPENEKEKKSSKKAKRRNN